MKVLFVSIISVMIITVTSVFAGTQGGTVDQLYLGNNNGLVAVWLSGQATEKAACSDPRYFVIRDETSVIGKQ